MMFRALVNFAGYLGCDEEYEIEADSRDEAEMMAMQMACDDMIIDIEEMADEEE